VWLLPLYVPPAWPWSAIIALNLIGVEFGGLDRLVVALA